MSEEYSHFNPTILALVTAATIVLIILSVTLSVVDRDDPQPVPERNLIEQPGEMYYIVCKYIGENETFNVCLGDKTMEEMTTDELQSALITTMLMLMVAKGDIHLQGELSNEMFLESVMRNLIPCDMREDNNGQGKEGQSN